MSTTPFSLRMGEGWDVHALVPGRPLMIGGVRIPHPYGVVAHSDGDVALHALVDALLGAIGAGDIGSHFPDTDVRFKGADSVVMLRETGRLLAERGHPREEITQDVYNDMMKDAHRAHRSA